MDFQSIVIYLLFVILTAFILQSCKSDIEKNVVGFWEIEQAYYNNDPVNNDLHKNIISFSGNGVCKLPTTQFESAANIRMYRVEKLSASKSSIIINSSNSVFNRIFLVNKFNKKTDEKTGYKYIEMNIVADSLKLEMIKKRDVE